MIRVCLPSGTQHGWGVAGTRITRELAKITEIAMPTDPKWPLLMAVRGPDFLPMNYLPAGPRNLGMAFIEQPSVAKDYIRNYEVHYTALVCGSRWMKERMEQIGVSPCSVVYQGVDYDVFYPDPEFLRPDDSPFTVLVGGKAEYRKGTDIAIAALKIFLEKHADARAIFCVANQWPITMHTLERSKWIEYRKYSDDWLLQMSRTIVEAGLPHERVRLVPLTENSNMPSIYRMAHVGLFLSRAEAGENMMLTEATACGLPSIATYATGQIDILDEIGFLAIVDGKVNEPDGWCEPESLEEIISSLETVYGDIGYARRRGLEDAARIREIRGWDKCAKELLGLLVE